MTQTSFTLALYFNPPRLTSPPPVARATPPGTATQVPSFQITQARSTTGRGSSPVVPKFGTRLGLTGSIATYCSGAVCRRFSRVARSASDRRDGSIGAMSGSRLGRRWKRSNDCSTGPAARADRTTK